ncbi:hypothetical protein AB8880_04125 [Alphaproteobacteria bacterium LSUCC0684]
MQYSNIAHPFGRLIEAEERASDAAGILRRITEPKDTIWTGAGNS